MVAIGVPRSWNLSLSHAPIALLSLPFVAEAAASYDGISPAKTLCLGALVDVPPLEIFDVGGLHSHYQVRALSSCRIGPSGPVAMINVGLLRACG